MKQIKINRKLYCEYCEQVFSSRYPKAKFCSRRCANTLGAKKRSEKARIVLTCKICTKQFKVLKDRLSAKYCSNPCHYVAKSLSMKGKRPFSREIILEVNRRKKGVPNLKNRGERPSVSGSKHWNWQGGISTLNKKEREIAWYTNRYTTWRKSVYRRDNYTCQDCGVQKTVLHAHHIKSWKDYPEYRYELDNGVTLCQNCHINTHRLKPKEVSWA